MMFEISYHDCYNDTSFHYCFNVDYFIKNRTLSDFKKLVSITLRASAYDQLEELAELLLTIKTTIYDPKQKERWKKAYDYLQKVRERYE